MGHSQTISTPRDCMYETLDAMPASVPVGVGVRVQKEDGYILEYSVSRIANNAGQERVRTW